MQGVYEKFDHSHFHKSLFQWPNIWIMILASDSRKGKFNVYFSNYFTWNFIKIYFLNLFWVKESNKRKERKVGKCEKERNGDGRMKSKMKNKHKIGTKKKRSVHFSVFSLQDWLSPKAWDHSLSPNNWWKMGSCLS